MFKYIKVLVVLFMSWIVIPIYAVTSDVQQNPVTAIDIALDPDSVMTQRALAVNAELLKNYPKGFKLDTTHRPHLSIVQMYVNRADLDKIYTDIEKIVTHENIRHWQLKAVKYYTPQKELGLAGIVVEPTADLLKLQQKLIKSVSPFLVKTGTATSFYTTPEDPVINQSSIDYVAEFIKKDTGENYSPHVTVGIGYRDYFEKNFNSFDVFIFSPVSISIYQLGPFGTARKKLKTWKWGS
jgi:hypothetical protein